MQVWILINKMKMQVSNSFQTFRNLRVKMSILKSEFLMQAQVKATMMNLHISQNFKYTWILLIKTAIIHVGLSTRKSTKSTFITVKDLLMSSLNCEPPPWMCHRKSHTRQIRLLKQLLLNPVFIKRLWLSVVRTR